MVTLWRRLGKRMRFPKNLQCCVTSRSDSCVRKQTLPNSRLSDVNMLLRSTTPTEALPSSAQRAGRFPCASKMLPTAVASLPTAARPPTRPMPDHERPIIMNTNGRSGASERYLGD